MDHIAAVEQGLVSPAGEPAQTELAIRHKYGVSTLLSRRDELRGVYAFADVVEESVRWSA
jgi:hypothetical protein